MKPVALFTRDVEAFWATTYQFDIKFFDQFLLRQLGDPPLNATVLCDDRCLTEALSQLTDSDLYAAKSANRRYLLRGIRLVSNGSFHPKTYLFVSRRRTLLLVGSGNLTRSGLDRGNETFVSFSAEDEEGRQAIRSWADWIGELVAARGDPELTRRFARLRGKLPLAETSPADGFITSARRPIAEQLVERCPDHVGELHLTAPFFDKGAVAVRKLIADLEPSDVIHLYLGARTNVDGASLRRALVQAPCRVRVSRFVPAAMVHAKLIGVLGSEGQGLLLCGSPNLSNAALRRTYEEKNTEGNCEVAVIRSGSRDEVLSSFQPSALTVEEADLSDVDALEFDRDETTGSSPGHWLRRANITQNGRIQVEVEPDPAGLLVAWGDAAPRLPLGADATTVDPVPEESDPLPLVVWLEARDGARASNPVVLDESSELQRSLTGREREKEPPPEIVNASERSELVRLLARANEQFIFDIDDTPAARRADNAQERQADVDDTGFWERYVREELSFDPRSQSYRRPTGGRTLSPSDLFLREIEAMLSAAPSDRRHLRVVRWKDDVEEDGPDKASGQPWSLSARERVRATYLLRRWCRAVADPRHGWLSPEAPARNFEALVMVLNLIWLSDALDEDKLVGILGELWMAFLGGENHEGFADRAGDELWGAALDSLSIESREIAAGLVFSALHSPRPWRSYVYEWQPALIRGLEEGVFASGDRAADVIEALCDERPSNEAIIELLRGRAEFIDEDTWCRNTAVELGFRRIELLPRFNPHLELAVRVTGRTEGARDARLIAVARRAIEFKSAGEVMVITGDERLRLRLGEVASARIDGEIRRSVVPIDKARLAAVEAEGGSFADLLGAASAA